MKILFIGLFCLSFISTIELEKRSLLDNKIEMLIPKDFKEMPKDWVKLKYPGKNRPDFLLTNEETTINIGLTLTKDPLQQDEIEDYLEIYKITYLENLSGITWIDDRIIDLNGKKIGCMKFITKAIDTRIYNYIFFSDIEKSLFMGTFNCPEQEMDEWAPISDKIVNSLKIK